MSKVTSISHKTTTKSVSDLVNLFRNGQLNLQPGFQRQSVWNDRDRVKLIDSILRNYPLPAIFLYKRNENGDFVYDVIDGKQRLETILKFTGELRGKFQVKTQLPDHDEVEILDFAALKRKAKQNLIMGYEIPVVEVDGEIGDIIDVFVRINSTGKALTSQEQRKARYYQSPLLKQADKLARKFEKHFRDQGIFSAGQISRMKHVELMCELMLSLHQGDVLNKKTALDKVMSTQSFDGRQLNRASRLVTQTVNRVKRMFPQLKTTRLRHVTDYYSLAVLIGKFEQAGLILADKNRNQIAWDLLNAFCASVDEIRELQRKAQGTRAGQELYRDYLLTVSQMTDDISQRRKREQILRGILESVFAKKDAQRGFTSEQRRIIWNTSTTRCCSHPGCKRKLTWDDFTIDHINPYSKGGRSQLDNAALMCRDHNSAKGNR